MTIKFCIYHCLLNIAIAGYSARSSFVIVARKDFNFKVHQARIARGVLYALILSVDTSAVHGIKIG